MGHYEVVIARMTMYHGTVLGCKQKECVPKRSRDAFQCRYS